MIAMKRILLRIAALSLLVNACVSCQTLEAQVQRLDPVMIGQLADIALTAAVGSGKISAGDAALIRAAGTIILPPNPLHVATEPPLAAKQPLAHLQP